MINKVLKRFNLSIVKYIDWDDGEQRWIIDSGFPGKEIIVDESAWGGAECRYSDGTMAGEPKYD